MGTRALIYWYRIRGYISPRSQHTPSIRPVVAQWCDETGSFALRCCTPRDIESRDALLWKDVLTTSAEDDCDFQTRTNTGPSTASEIQQHISRIQQEREHTTKGVW